MIKQLRIDNRLVHGEVIALWLPSLSADTLVLADDMTAKTPMMSMAMQLAKPKGIEMPILSIDDAISYLNDSANEKKRIFVICADIQAAIRLAKACDEIQDINIGAVSHKPGAKQVSMRVFVDDKDIEGLRELDKLNRNVFQQTKTDEKVVSLKGILSSLK